MANTNLQIWAVEFQKARLALTVAERELIGLQRDQTKDIRNKFRDIRPPSKVAVQRAQNAVTSAKNKIFELRGNLLNALALDKIDPATSGTVLAEFDKCININRLTIDNAKLSRWYTSYIVPLIK